MLTDAAEGGVNFVTVINVRGWMEKEGKRRRWRHKNEQRTMQCDCERRRRRRWQRNRLSVRSSLRQVLDFCHRVNSTQCVGGGLALALVSPSYEITAVPEDDLVTDDYSIIIIVSSRL